MSFSSRFARNCLRALATISLVVPIVCAGVEMPSAKAMEPGDGVRPVRASAKKLAVVDATGIYEHGLSGFGLLARMASTGRLDAAIAKARLTGTAHVTTKMTPTFRDEDDGTLIPGGQAEFTIAVDVTGNNVVAGFNDTRGFSLNPISVSGYAYSSNGGTTFTDGGQLPAVTVGHVGATNYPQVFGDPDIKYVSGGAGCQFIYSSIAVVGLGPAPNYTGTAQSMSVHRSTDCGQTWTGPFEVTPATNPHGVLITGNASDAADKEFIDVDPETNRVLLSWSNFSTTVEISTTFSDNIMSGSPPTWSARVIVTPGTATQFDTGSVPRFAGNASTNAYVTWSRQDFNESTPYGGGACGNTMFSRSTDNGATWSAPIKLHSGGIGGVCGAVDFWPMDYVLGDDRIHSFPGMAVDTTAGTHTGWIYIAYAGNDSKDGGDINFVKR